MRWPIPQSAPQVGQPLALQAAQAELDPYQAQEREYEELLCLSSKKTGQKCTEARPATHAPAYGL